MRRGKIMGRSTEQIDTVFFDVGATLRYVVPDAEFSAEAERGLMELTRTKENHDEFFAKLEKNWKAYRKMAKTELIDVSEMELWLYYLLPDYDPDIIAPNAARLTRLWRDRDGRRVAHEDVVPTLLELKKRGYKLGIIANTITETEIPDWMCTAHVASAFQSVILSSKVRIRKPDPAIYLLASRSINSKPETCAYVGDNPVRDVDGALNAGYGSMILYEDAGTADREGVTPTNEPDYVIRTLGDLLDLFPPRE
jgi:putative hydrolase of the HAD superfamily